MGNRTRRSKLPDLTVEESRDLLNGDFASGHRLAGAARLNLLALLHEWQAARLAPPNAFEQKMDAPVAPLLKMKLPAGSPTFREVEQCLRVFLAPNSTGAGFMVDYGPRRPWTSWDLAWCLFFRLLQDDRLKKLGGPCEKCGRYYLRKTTKGSVYCSRTCATQATALRRTKEVRRERHDRKLERAGRAIHKWQNLVQKGRTTKRWQEFVVSESKRDGDGGEITVRFLSRAVNSGELMAPQAPRR